MPVALACLIKFRNSPPLLARIAIDHWESPPTPETIERDSAGGPIALREGLEWPAPVDADVWDVVGSGHRGVPPVLRWLSGAYAPAAGVPLPSFEVPESHAGWVGAAFWAYRRCRWAMAADLFAKIAGTGDPQVRTMATYERGVALAGAGRADEAEAALWRAVEFGKADQDAFWLAITQVALGTLLVREGREPGAIAVLREVVQDVDPLDERSYNWLNILDSISHVSTSLVTGVNRRALARRVAAIALPVFEQRFPPHRDATALN